MENVRQYKNIRLISCGRQHTLYTSRPQFTRFEIIDENLVCAELIKPRIILNKPIFCGLSILDLSKRYMFDFHYNVIRKNFDSARVAFCDTDSFIYHLKTDNIFDELKKIKKYMDFAKYPRNHELFDNSKKNVPGFFKDEMAGTLIRSFCGLHAKCYSILTFDNEQKLATAGITRFCHDALTHDKFVSVLADNSFCRVKQKTIVSKNHELFTVMTDRVALSAMDPKRYVLDDYVKTLPYGHYKI